jgi:thiol-disulfide isomerase/thioredoxin
MKIPITIHPVEVFFEKKITAYPKIELPQKGTMSTKPGAAATESNYESRTCGVNESYARQWGFGSIPLRLLRLFVADPMAFLKLTLASRSRIISPVRASLWRRAAMLLVPAFTLGGETAHALYQTGQVVTNNFSFIARRPFTRPDGTAVPAGAQVRIQDFAGRVVFLEWFAVWCPYCVAAAPQVETGIVDWYDARGGNPNGVPVLHIAVNQEANAAYQTSTDNFINQQGFGVVVNDYDGSVINPVRFQFQSGGQPTFVVLNGVTNSPSHLPWQILVNEQRYGQTDFSQTLAGYRAIIDTVQPGIAPVLLNNQRRIGADFEFNFQTQPGRTYRVQASADLVNWTTLQTFNGATNVTTFRHTNAPPVQNFYRVITP